MPPRKRAASAALVLKVNMTGPDGTGKSAGDVVPQEWLDHPEFDAEHLVASGGAKRKG